MRRPVHFAVALAALLCLAQAAPPPSPQQIYGPLFEAVQSERVFEDGKTFVDAVPKGDPAAIVEAYRREQPKGAALRQFVLRHFSVPGEQDERPAQTLRDHIRALWPQLTRPALNPPAGSSALSLPAPYVVPGGRFREIYYWDSYFTMLGLKVDGEQKLVESMLDDFVSLIDRFGHIPNGTRTYYISRSQPPFFALMLDLSDSDDSAVKAKRLAALRTEYRYWMAGAACATRAKPCANVVVMPDGSRLNRYWDERDTPRDESFAEDRATAAKVMDRPAAQTYRDLRAGAESGWDFSSRWLADPKRLSTIRTTHIVPVDLNSLLWRLERAIAERCATAGDAGCARQFHQFAAARKAAIDRWLWLPDAGRYADWDMDSRQATPIVSAATLFPLFVGLTPKAQADAVARLTRDQLVGEGGLRTTRLATGQQWDSPNGWAPLQWVAIDGLARAGHPSLARDIARRWISTVDAAFRETGKMLEKYDVEDRKPGGGGEYPLQDGFGWTNGVTAALIARWPDLAPDASVAAGR